MKKIFLLLALGVVLFSCSTTKTTTSSAPVDVSDKLVEIPEGKSVIYIVRPSAFGFLIPITVKIDDREIGTTMAEKYLYAIESPGEHTITAKAENNAELVLTTEAGKTYFIQQDIRMGLIMARNKLNLIDAEEGKRKLAKCKLPDSFVKPE